MTITLRLEYDMQFGRLENLDSLITLVLVLAPLFVGFALPSKPSQTQYADQMLSYLVYLILILVGIELAQVHGLQSQLGDIALYVLALTVLTIGSGLIALMLLDRLLPWQSNCTASQMLPHKISIRGSLLQLGSVAIGLVIGRLLPKVWLPPDQSMTALLMLLILLVGIGLKGSGVTLKEVLVNKRGIQMSVIFTLVVLASGALFALIFQPVTLTQGMALSAGFGWYSLSAIVMTEAYGAVWGSVALINDLIREFAALLFIPVLMRRYPSAAVGLGGATSLDFTLPVIQRSGGLRVVPLAISFGFIINIISPVCMVALSALG